MLPWLILALVVVAAAVVQWWSYRSHQATLQQLKQQNTESLVVQNDEHRAHIQRLKREHQKALARAPQALVRTLLPRLDALQHAYTASQQDNTTVEDLEEGLGLLWKDLCKALEEHKISLIEPTPGEPFDPKLHEAVGIIAAPTLPEGHIAQVLRSGWTHGDDLIRAATVQTVAKHQVASTLEEFPRARPPQDDGDKTGVLGVMDFVESTNAGQEEEVDEPPTRIAPVMKHQAPQDLSLDTTDTADSVFNIRPKRPGPSRDLQFDDSTAITHPLAHDDDFEDERTRVSPAAPPTPAPQPAPAKKLTFDEITDINMDVDEDTLS